jgi:hypothetical protein
VACFVGLGAKTIVLFLALCLGTIALGHLNVDDRAAIFQVCNRNPCFLGIEPGVTAWDEVADKLSQLEGETKTYPGRARRWLATGEIIVIDQSADEQSAGRVYVSFSDEAAFPVGWIIERYGAPCGVSYYRERMLVLRYPTFAVNTLPLDLRFGPYAAVSNIQFNDPSFHPDFGFDPCRDNGSLGVSNQPWRGFYAARRYHATYSTRAAS